MGYFHVPIDNVLSTISFSVVHENACFMACTLASVWSDYFIWKLISLNQLNSMMGTEFAKLYIAIHYKWL